MTIKMSGLLLLNCSKSSVNNSKECEKAVFGGEYELVEEFNNQEVPQCGFECLQSNGKSRLKKFAK